MRNAALLLPLVFVLAACAKPSPSVSSKPPAPELSANSVPEDLRHLLPLARKWGVGDDEERTRLIKVAVPAEKEFLRAAVDPYARRINAWLDSFGQNPMTEEAAAFMYMLETLDEMGPP